MQGPASRWVEEGSGQNPWPARALPETTRSQSCPALLPHFLPFHISNRYGFNRSNSRHKLSMLFSTSLAEVSRFSTRNVYALPRKSGANAWIMWSRLITDFWYETANSYTVRTHNSAG